MARKIARSGDGILSAGRVLEKTSRDKEARTLARRRGEKYGGRSRREIGGL
jgi:hypothetical protein